jgi:flagellar L-ring protein precursor FlgH
MRVIREGITVLLLVLLAGCVQSRVRDMSNPALEYAQSIRGVSVGEQLPGHYPRAQQVADRSPRAQIRFAGGNYPDSAVITNLPSQEPGRLPVGEAAADYLASEPGEYYEYRSAQPESRAYMGPLELGDPGVSASLWNESRGGNNLFRDPRAFQPMDLVTIVVSESSQAQKEADTEIKESATVLNAITNLLGFDADVTASNPNIDLSSLVNATTTNDFKGEGDTSRRDELNARISAMVVEVLPSGILRVAGKRIISVNDEEQVMVISGLARPRDISADNEIQSSQMANLRVDYFGNGIVSEAQNGGWLSRFLRNVWPF